MAPQHNNDTIHLLNAFRTATSAGPFAETATQAHHLAGRLGNQDSGPEEMDTLRAISMSIQEMSVDELIQIVRLITARFHLLNKVEQLQIIRINRERAQAATKESPRSESVRSAVLELENRGRSRSEIQ